MEFEGNTSTDVEKTLLRHLSCEPPWKHLHGRGEDFVMIWPLSVSPETPPRTWRRLDKNGAQVTLERNTSTDVEKTCASFRVLNPSWKHLHGRGEDRNSMPSACASAETPPRTWRRRYTEILRSHFGGNTSTDVEKTLPKLIELMGLEKHLHGRGEDPE